MTLYICLMVAVVLSDQLLKFYVQQNVPLNVSYEVIPGVLSIGYVRNFGAAWSMWLGQRWLLSDLFRTCVDLSADSRIF